MLEYEVNNSRLRIVAEFEADYERRAFEKALAEKDEVIAETKSSLAENESLIVKRDNEIQRLKAILNENGISY